jgi:hypothetical protein
MSNHLRTFFIQGLMSLVALSLSTSCVNSKPGFAGLSNKLKTQTAPPKEAPALGQAFSVQLPEALSSFAKRDIWFVSSAGRVERFSLKNPGAAKNDEIWGSTGVWQLAGGGSGHRTYVSEIGLVIGKTGGYMYLIGDDTQPGTTVDPIWTATSPASITWPPHTGQPARLCVTSFRSGGKTFLGGAYTKEGNKLAFVRIPVDKTKPQKVDVAAAEETIIGDGVWGYSCFTDQSRNVFYSQLWGPGPIHGIQLDSKKHLTANKDAPNGAFAGPKMNWFDQKTTEQGSYVLAGDPFGNIYNQASMYTYAYDPLSKMVFGTAGAKITVTRVECFASKSNCVEGVDHWVWDQAALGLHLGPMSSLNDGRVVGIGRGDNSELWLLSLKDPKDPSQGPVAKKIADAAGDGYMYSDFTGATLYASELEKSSDLNSDPKFVPTKKVVVLKGKWNAESAQPEEWRGLKLQVRCYAKDVKEKPAYEDIPTVPPAGVDFPITSSSCNNSLFDTIETHVIPDNSIGGFSKTRSFEFFGNQEK